MTLKEIYERLEQILEVGKSGRIWLVMEFIVELMSDIKAALNNSQHYK